ncbi:MAG: recombination-associated protein RdgC [Gammaproteobacteria bacterium]|nr:recombination-associated protein RdgC [Gammaproteobacteria bacterium]
MWFRNLVVYRLPAGWSTSAAQLEEALSGGRLRPCSPLEMQSRGWVEAAPDGRLVHALAGHLLIALGTEQKLLPASIVRQVAKERAVEIAAEQGHPVGRRQMRDLKARVLEELRARALTRRRVTRAWIDPEGGRFVVEAAGAARAEQVVEALRMALDSFAVQPLKGERTPHATFAGWLRHGDLPPRFSIEPDLELKAPDKARGSIRYNRHPFDPRQIQSLLAGGLLVTRLGLSWRDRVAFAVNDKLEFKRVELLDVDSDADAADAVDGEDAADEAARFDADFVLMTGELAGLLAEIDAAMGSAADVPAQRAA